ncbi:MAG: DNA-directed RNA polymerase subunit omega [candidate division WOR-3 bacterium]|nr:MAG: DNA-directed RNA polymerase subunit omega [candidate division WOR-3 bacterium]
MIIPVEKIWKKFQNKYKAINIASLEARRLKEEQGKGLVDEKMNPILEAMRRLLSEKIKFAE